MASPHTLDTESMRRALRGAVDGPLVDQIIAGEARLRAAQLAADVTELDALIADPLLFAGPDGQLATKAQDLAAHASGAVRFLAHEPEALHIQRVNDDCALVSLLTTLQLDAGGAGVHGRFRYTRVWARDTRGAWQVVGGHVSAASSVP